MSKVIRIGTRDSELAMWQAKTVKTKLDALGHKTKIIAVKSTGDLVLDKPLYELGITGIFTKTLDVAMLNGDIDIAVHSMKDVPTALPKGIVQAAVLERANYLDILAFKNNEEFLGHPEGIIATGSLRRKAQWLNRYPTHTVVDLRGNVNSRMQKLMDNDWNGAIFAAAGLERIGIEHEHTIGLTWMVPAPAQGAIMVVSLENDPETTAICAALNDERTEICVTQEREFLRLLEGGCTAPIGALAYINNEDEVVLKGVLLTVDGTKKLEAEITAPLGEHQHIGRDCANSILSRGGKRLMSEMQSVDVATQIFSTKKLTEEQQRMFSDGIEVKSTDFIQTSPARIAPALLKKEHNNVIITSQNAVESLLTHTTATDLKFKNIYCVGRKTKRLVENSIGKVTYTASNAKKLAEHLVAYLEGTEVSYFCSNIRMNDLPEILEANNIIVNEIETYKTKHTPIELESSVEGVLFFSPSAIDSYLTKNDSNKTAYCIGETTAAYARLHFKDVRVAKLPSVEDVIALVNENYSN